MAANLKTLKIQVNNDLEISIELAKEDAEILSKGKNNILLYIKNVILYYFWIHCNITWNKSCLHESSGNRRTPPYVSE